jgi:large subunit ribosomal protein L13
MEYNLDATGEKLGRLSTKVAILLMGKNITDFQKNVVADVKVNISNVSKLDISSKKMEQKEYSSYSGYPGGRKVRKMKAVVQKKGQAELVRKAVRGMLPANKLRPVIMKNLIIK